ncbi:exodeoxyribonuclease V subunit beta [Vibrio mangrovi]|uniref:RecBCD enzyme subunit RecB n=1 Tax=Vibrio mangrovi TaxID=474394 RepID=A0A1Y6IRP8_9VIBR|nr:exodeoxyribonuclease V subunit beta [Vibrio mangrovi]MDW6001675.1 exodeoxyribonuclease V subunit beta [Vibrio mangrovi]SMS00298.1 RecBCD enzyme subunit RecB [Vibrio mangrovi]
MSHTTSDAMIPLEPMSFPLHGARLIEASAGTGKTFTIAGLYLRLLLGHGDEQSRHSSALRVDQILVVTFTEAATAELKGRIRERIHEARLAFARSHSDDSLLQLFLDEIPDHAAAADVLLQAEREMDTAAIYTIHGFCQRMLVQNAFESGSRFHHEFITDESRLKAQVVADYWRRQFYPLPVELAAEVRRLWPTPADLLAQIATYLSGHAPYLSVRAMDASLEQLHQDNLQRIVQLKTQWLKFKPDIAGCITGSDVNKRSYTKKSLPQWIEQVSLWAETATESYEIPEQLLRFSQQALYEKTPQGTPPEHPLFQEIDEFLAMPVSIEAPLKAHAIETCRSLLVKSKQEQHWLSFDDLLSHLSSALDVDTTGQLALRIRTLYPVAMIDEFQDTDPLQYHIFSNIYAQHPECGLLMIGDPKQAIYAFRGADIFTYIKARHQVRSHFTLATNWRSGQSMIEAVNRLFSSSESPFLYDQDIPFFPVSSPPHAKERRWQLYQKDQPAMTYWWPDDDEPDAIMTKADYYQMMADATAARIQTILQAADQGEGILCSGDEERVIQAGHIAVLVRTGNEGRLVKEALARQGIASVYLSNRDSVFGSDIAVDIQRLLQAVLMPDQERPLRAALASPLFGLDIHYLDALNINESLWESVVQEFREYRKIWFERGILPMLRAVLYQRHLAERWLMSKGGERLLTDYLHLGELLQQAGAEIDSDHGLLRWLTQSIMDVNLGSSPEASIQRLESEKNLVQIVTIHKSKGLEYDLVFLPFVMSFRETKEARYYDETHDRIVLDMARREEALSMAEKERLAEDLRLLYVALTRSVFGCYVGIAPLKGRSVKGSTGAHLCAMGYLLQQGEPGDAALLRQGIESLLDEHGQTVMEAPPPIPDSPLSLSDVPSPELSARQKIHPIERLWRMTSYSNLVKQSGHHEFLDATREVPGFDLDSAGEADEYAFDPEEQTIFTFPKGATAGTFLHSLFEQIEFTESPESDANTQIIQVLMETAAVSDSWLPVLQQMLNHVLQTPLDGKKLRLGQIPERQRLVEMEFLLPVDKLRAPMLNRILKRYDSLSAQAGDLNFAQVKGMLKGFIDLVFEYQGQYYVLDWKSNHLGHQCEDYTPARLKAAMVEHRYDFQYQIYSLALHRFLASRITDYSYEQHFGGVYYIFLRGVDGQTPSGIFSHRPDFELITALDRFFTGEEDAMRSTHEGQMELDL